MKRILIFAAIVCAASAAAWILAGSFFNQRAATAQPWTARAAKVLPAAREYAKILRAEDKPVPAYVDVKDLVAKGLLSKDDLRAFAGMEVSVRTLQEQSRPDEVLVRAQQADGEDITLLADGSVHNQRR